MRQRSRRWARQSWSVGRCGHHGLRARSRTSYMRILHVRVHVLGAHPSPARRIVPMFDGCAQCPHHRRPGCRAGRAAGGARGTPADRRQGDRRRADEGGGGCRRHGELPGETAAHTYVRTCTCTCRCTCTCTSTCTCTFTCTTCRMESSQDMAARERLLSPAPARVIQMHSIHPRHMHACTCTCTCTCACFSLCYQVISLKAFSLIRSSVTVLTYSD